MVKTFSSKQNFHHMVERLTMLGMVPGIPDDIAIKFTQVLSGVIYMYILNAKEGTDITDMDVLLESLLEDFAKGGTFAPYVKELIILPYLKARLDEKYGVNLTDAFFTEFFTWNEDFVFWFDDTTNVKETVADAKKLAEGYLATVEKRI